MKLGSENEEVTRLLRRVRELELLVNENSGLHDDVTLAIKDRRETGSRINRMSLELESSNLEKIKLEKKVLYESVYVMCLCTPFTCFCCYCYCYCY
jgi:hypothetical protein